MIEIIARRKRADPLGVDQIECKMPQFVLQTSDSAPVRFNGELLAEYPAPTDPPPFSRWHEIRIYKTASGKFVLEIVFGSNATNSDKQLIEPPQHDVFVCESPDAVLDELQKYDPMGFVIGYPEGVENSRKKNDRLRKTVVAEFQQRVGAVLATAAQKEPDFAEEI